MSKFLLLIVFSVVALAGCASSKVSCLHDHKIVTAKADTELVRMPYVDVTHEGDSVIVSGAIKRSYSSLNTITTHIDITILDEKGAQVMQTRTDEIHVPSRQVGKGLNFTRFKVSVPIDVQQNLTVHAQPHSEPSCAIQKS